MWLVPWEARPGAAHPMARPIATNTTVDRADLIEFIQKSAGKGYPQVFFVGYDKNGKRTTLYQGDLPKTSAEFLQLMSKYGG